MVDAYHAADYMVYAQLQLGRDQAARQVLAEFKSEGAAALPQFAGPCAAVAMPARLVVERSNWAAAAQLPMQGTNFAQCEAITAYARALAPHARAMCPRPSRTPPSWRPCTNRSSRPRTTTGLPRWRSSASPRWPGSRRQRAADVHNELGFTHRQLGQLDKAFEHYKRALAIDPRHRGAHEYIGEAYLLAGDVAAAEQHLAALQSLCTLPCEEKRDLQGAIEAYRRKAPGR